MTTHQPEQDPDQQPMRDFDTRRHEVGKIRDLARDNALSEFSTGQPPINTDEARFEALGRPGFASFTKALSHNDNGLVQELSFNSLLAAIQMEHEWLQLQLSLVAILRLT